MKHADVDSVRRQEVDGNQVVGDIRPFLGHALTGPDVALAHLHKAARQLQGRQ